jgi:hypothetical protein
VTFAAIGFRIDTDDGVFRNSEIVIDNGVFDARVCPDLHAGEQQAVLDRRLAFDPYPR